MPAVKQNVHPVYLYVYEWDLREQSQECLLKHTDDNTNDRNGFPNVKAKELTNGTR